MNPKNPNWLSLEEARSFFSYDSRSGEIKWRVKLNGRILVDSLAGWISQEGYRIVGVKSRSVAAHRLAWFLHYGEWPSLFIDHIDGDKLNNSLENLREATRQENNRNKKVHGRSKTRVKGVTITSSGKYLAKIKVDGVEKRIGLYPTIEKAKEAYEAEAAKLFGVFRYNR